MNHCFAPGKVWLDTQGKRIHAHGGSVLQVGDVFYWYGENKERTDGQNGIWHWGVRCYSSVDLYNWKDEGIIIPPNLADETSTLHPSSQMDRPHIIYNKQTKKYVCWLKIMGEVQTEIVLTSDDILGPYTIVRERLKPLGMGAGDFDLAVAPDGKAYYFFERVHSETICADLTPDYTNVTGYYSTHFPRPYPLFVREATAHFVRNGKHYLLTSGTTGYLPNPSEFAVADSWHGPYQTLGNPHPADESDTSFHSQISSVFKVPGKQDLYIACADRWVPELMHLDYHFYSKAYQAIHSGNRQAVPQIAAEFGISQHEPMQVFGDAKRNTSIANYVWLPLRFAAPDAQHPHGMVYIDWLDEWSLDDYE